MDPTEEIDPTGPADTPARRPVRGRRAPRDVEEVRLRDGSRIWVRPIRPEDRELIVEGLTKLSARSRYLRFHTHVDHLSRAQLDYLVDVDHHDHDALVAFDPDIDGEPGVAVARYIRMADDPSIAEAAITVVDDHQGRGIGTTLIGLLERVAHERGIRTFRNYVLAENRTMLDIFAQLDGDVTLDGPGLYRVDVPVPGAEDAHPDTPAGRWVSQLGREQRDASSWAYPVLWLLSKVTRADLAAPPPEGGSRLLKRRAGHDDRDGEAGPDDVTAG